MTKISNLAVFGKKNKNGHASTHPNLTSKVKLFKNQKYLDKLSSTYIQPKNLWQLFANYYAMFEI
jgi:hypothetical protein